MSAESKNRITELMIACSRGEQARAEGLVASGADVNARDRFGYSALMYAAGGGHSAVVEMLLSSGADVGAKNRNGLTGLDLAAARGHATIAGLLRNARFFHAERKGHARVAAVLRQVRAESPWGDLPPTEMPAELPDDSEDLKPLIEMPDHPDA